MAYFQFNNGKTHIYISEKAAECNGNGGAVVQIAAHVKLGRKQIDDAAEGGADGDGKQRVPKIGRCQERLGDIPCGVKRDADHQQNTAPRGSDQVNQFADWCGDPINKPAQSVFQFQQQVEQKDEHNCPKADYQSNADKVKNFQGEFPPPFLL